LAAVASDESTSRAAKTPVLEKRILKVKGVNVGVKRR
jgi:hypothetical protein